MTQKTDSLIVGSRFTSILKLGRGPLFTTLWSLALGIFATGCQSKTSPAGNISAPQSQVKVQASAERGRVVYKTQCIACHNSDPHKSGALGPDVFGSSKELLTARIMRAEYPPNYQPKRATHIMVALPHLKDEIDSLELYLNGK